MKEVLDAKNLQAALKRVKKNKGSPGIDGMTVEELPVFLREHWLEIRGQLTSGRYQPQPVRQVMIPKSDGGMRKLGIPTVLDRFIQQALLQVLQRQLDRSFSDHSYGFRPGRSAHQAARAARAYVQEGRQWVVDVDLSKFFDRVHHDKLMGRLANRIVDKTVLRLIRGYLNAGIMASGVVTERHEGTPQGGPLSPLLANLFLDEVDKELEKRGHAFVRYADDCNVYVRSQRAGERVMCFLRKRYEKLGLRINEEKSAVALATERAFLGFSLWTDQDDQVKLSVSRKALRAMKRRVRKLTRRVRGRSLSQIVGGLRVYLLGWRNYYRLADTPRIFLGLDQWIRRRLRAYQLKQWKHSRNVARALVARGASPRLAGIVAANTSRWWYNSAGPTNIAFPIRFFDELGVPRLAM